MSFLKEEIKEKLLARKRELEEGLQRLAEDRASVEAEEVQDPLDQARALSMIEAGTYGTCSDCQQRISEKRLELYPNATRCIGCQELRETNT